MNAEPLAPHLRACAPNFAARLAPLLAALANLIAYRFDRNPRFATILSPLYFYINRAARRMAALMARVAAGRPRRPASARPPATQTDSRKPRFIFPAGIGWLIGAIPHEAVTFGGYIEQLLAEPAIAELLAAVPAARRILAPLRRALSTEQPKIRRAVRHPVPPVPIWTPDYAPPRRIPLHILFPMGLPKITG